MNPLLKSPQQHGSCRLESFKNLSGTTLIFGGTFDPVHNGHIEAALTVKAASHAVNVVLIPTHRNPLKQKGPVASEQDRLELLELAIACRPGLYVSDIECCEGARNFTADTLRQIRAEAPNLPLQFAFGADQLPSLHHWHEHETLIELAQIWVVGREAVQGSDAIDACTNLSPKLRKELKERFVSLSVDVSSTAIRAALASIPGELMAGNPLRHLAPAVAARIAEKGLYRNGGV